MQSDPRLGTRTRVNFETGGPSWAERAHSGELSAVFSPAGTERRNLFLHTVSLYAAQRVLRLRSTPGVLLDFGCGTGRMVRFFAARGWSVVGTEITREMIAEAQRFGLPPGTEVHLTDGVAIPLSDNSVDIVWVCGVLKYALFPPGALCRGGGPTSASGVSGDESSRGTSFVPVYRDVAQEIFRVLRPGGWVVNNEVYVDSPPEAFTADFEDVGFVTVDVRVLQRYFEPFAKQLQAPWMPRWGTRCAARLYAAARYHFDRPNRRVDGLRDYLFVWRKREATDR
jgi:SAM-dependent methyltransferase